MKIEDKDKEQKHDVEGSKEKERCREKYMGKSIQELDLSGCKRCTPSYRLLPDDVCIFFFLMNDVSPLWLQTVFIFVFVMIFDEWCYMQFFICCSLWI